MLRKVYYVNMFTILVIKQSFSTETKKSLPHIEVDSIFCYHFLLPNFQKEVTKFVRI